MGHLLTIAILLCASIAHAATYYVDFVGGSDAANGTSTGTAWQHCPGDTNATSTADSTTLVAGDTVKFKGGVTYLGGVFVDWSGAAGSPITYDGNLGGDWGSGRAVIDRQYALNAGCFYGSTAGRGNITIQGFELRNAGGWADDDPAVTDAAAGTATNSTARSGGGVLFGGGNHTNIVLNGLYIHRIGGWRNTLGWTTASIEGAGIYLLNAHNVTITNCEMTKMKVGVAINSSGVSQNITVRNCDIHDYITWGVDVATIADNAVFDAITIRDSTIRDYAQFNLGNWLGVGEGPHTDGIFLRTAAYTATGWTNILVFNNHFYCDNPESSAGGTASIFVSQGASALIYNNIFNEDSHSRAIGIEHFTAGSTDQQVRIFNNTFLMASPGVIAATETDPTHRYLAIHNNLFLQPSGQSANWIMLNRSSGVDPDALNWNLYYDPDFAAGDKYTHYFGSYQILAAAQAAGWDTNSTYAAPFVVDWTNATPSLRNFALLTNSPAIEAGTNLTAYFTTDYAGNARPGTGKWTVGAYQEAGTNAPSPTPTITTLRAWKLILR